MSFAHHRVVITIGIAGAFALVACQDQVPTEAKAPKTTRQGLHASIMGTRIGNAIDIGSGFGGVGGDLPMIADNGDIGGNGTDVDGTADGMFWSPSTGLVDLGSPPGCTSAFVSGINGSDQVIGWAACNANSLPFRWTPLGGFELLAAPPMGGYTGSQYTPEAINKDGIVAGSAFGQYLVRWSANGQLEVAQFGAGCPSAQVGASSMYMNDAGQVTGTAYCAGAAGYQTFFWSPGSPAQVIGTLGGAYAFPAGINNHGTVVGFSQTVDLHEHSFRWTQDGGIQDLGMLGTGEQSRPVGVADDESIAGFYTGIPGGGDDRTFRWTPSSGMQDLGLFPGEDPALPGSALVAAGMSPSGLITGYGITSDNFLHAFLWSDADGLHDLGALMGGHSQGETVNSAGQVAGFWEPADGSLHWVRWDAPSSTTTQSATLTLSNLQQVYDGTPKLATVTTAPADLTGVWITYSQGGTAVTSPINAGSYDVVAMLTNSSYTAPQVMGTLVIARAAQTITFGAIPTHSLGAPPFSVSATGGASGTPVTFATTTPGVCTVAGSTVTLVASGTCTIDASQTGTANYAPASDVARSFQVTLPFSGFLPPLAGTALHRATAGAGVAINFTLGGDRGLNVLAAGSPSSAPVSCSSGAVLGAATPAQSAGNVGLQYDATTGEYTYVWKTDRSWSGSCRTLSLSLTDGSTYQARFQFR